MPTGSARHDADDAGGGAADGGGGKAHDEAVGERPDPAVTAVPGTRFRDVRWLEETGSTNDDVLGLARDGAPEGLAVVARVQRAGRGRRGRSWVAPPGSALLVSVLLRPPAPVAGLTTFTVGLAMAEAVEELAGFPPGLKWPNDLVVPGDDGDRKLAGILAETDWPPGASIAGGWRQPAGYERVTVVAGVGINLRWPRDDAGEPASGERVPSEVLDTATAVNLVAGVEVPRSDLLVAFLTRLEHHYGGMVASGSGAAVLAAWRRRSATLGRRVRVELGPDDLEGVAVDVTEEGHLVVDTLEGDRRQLAVGDIVHLRAR